MYKNDGNFSKQKQNHYHFVYFCVWFVFRYLYVWLLVICVFAVIFSLHIDYNDSENEIKSSKYVSYASNYDGLTTGITDYSETR